jgi:hypothetical protein
MSHALALHCAAHHTGSVPVFVPWRYADLAYKRLFPNYFWH